jgi:hypothetical protein
MYSTGCRYLITIREEQNKERMTTLHSYQHLYEMRCNHQKPKGKLHDNLGYLHAGVFIWLSGGIRVTDYNITTNFGKDAAVSVLPFPIEFTSRLGKIMSFNKIESTMVFINLYVQGDQLPFDLTMPDLPWDIKNYLHL